MGVGYNPKIVTSNLVFAMDAANKKSFSPNIFPKPLDIASWYIAIKGNNNGNNCNVASDSTTAKSPAGGIAMKMNVNSDLDPYISSYGGSAWNLSVANNGQTWNVSVYVKADQAANGEIYIFGANSTGVVYDPVNNRYFGIVSKTFNITTDWTRQSHSITFNDANVAYIQVRVDGPQANGNTRVIYWDGLQVERSNSTSSFSPVYNANSANVIDLNAGSHNGTLYGNAIFEDANSSLKLKYTSNDYIGFANTTDFMFLNTAPYTLEAWVYPTRNPGASNWTGIFDRESSIAVGRDGYNLFFVGSAGTSTQFTSERFVAGVNTSTYFGIDQSLSVNTWNHIVATYDGTTLSIYRNGVSQNNISATGNITNQSKTLTIGNRGGNYFDGKISAAKIYSKALTAAEVSQNFNALRGRFGI